MGKRALITGVTGQDGSYLAEFLLEKGYEVYGMIRRSSVDYRERIAHLEGRRGVKTLTLASTGGAKKPVNWAFLRLHRVKIYIIERYF